MSDYIKFYDGAERWLRIVLSVFFVPAFLYRLFKVIISKAEDPSQIVYLVLSVLPIIGTIVLVLDIVWCALNRSLPTNLSDVFAYEGKKDDGTKEDAIDAEVVHEDKAK